MAKLIQRVNCVETPAGYVLTWDVAHGVTVVRTTIYGLNREREFILESPIIATGRFVLSPKNYSLVEAFKVQVTSDSGDVETSDAVSPQRVRKQERLLLNEMRKRAEIYMSSSPIGSYPMVVLLKHTDGVACRNCGGEVCSGRGGIDAVSDYCTICLGTGKDDPYYVYPETVIMHGVSPKDDNNVMENPDVQRSHVVRAFQSVFDIPLREGDILVSGTEAYRILDQMISASVGNVPVYYNLSTVKYAPEDPRYPTIMDLAYGRC